MKMLAASLGAVILVVSLPCQGSVAEWHFTSGGSEPYLADEGDQVGTADVTSAFANSTIGGGILTLNDPAYNTIQIHVNGTGLANFVVDYRASVSSGTVAQDWYWTDGVTPHRLDPLYQPTATLTTTLTSFKVDFSHEAGLNVGGGLANVYFYNELITDQNVQYDDVVVNVPEPINVALALFGLGAAGLTIARRVRAA